MRDRIAGFAASSAAICGFDAAIASNAAGSDIIPAAISRNHGCCIISIAAAGATLAPPNGLPAAPVNAANGFAGAAAAPPVAPKRAANGFAGADPGAPAAGAPGAAAAAGAGACRAHGFGIAVFVGAPPLPAAPGAAAAAAAGGAGAAMSARPSSSGACTVEYLARRGAQVRRCANSTRQWQRRRRPAHVRERLEAARHRLHVRHRAIRGRHHLPHVSAAAARGAARGRCCGLDFCHKYILYLYLYCIWAHE
jgi:hypothetical protein